MVECRPLVVQIGVPGQSGAGVSAAQWADHEARLNELESSPDFTGSISVAGNSALGNSASDTTTVYRLATAGNNPTFTVGAAMGSSPGAQTKVGDDTSCSIIQSAGTSCTTGVLWSVAFVTARAASTYRVYLTALGSNAADCRLYVTNRSTGGFDIACRVAPADSTQVAVNFLVVQ